MRNPNLTLISVLSILAIMLFGCYYDIKEQLYPAGAAGKCDTAGVIYSKTIVSILQNNSCFTCHSGSAAAGANIALDTYAGVKTYALNGKLYGSISQSPGYFAMPLGGNKASSCDISKLQVWINGGSLNN